MDYKVKKLPTYAGRITLSHVASVMAESDANYGGIFDKKVFNLRIAENTNNLMKAARDGRLAVCNQFGKEGTVEEIVKEARSKGYLVDDRNLDEAEIFALYTYMPMLNEWGKRYGHTFVPHEYDYLYVVAGADGGKSIILGGKPEQEPPVVAASEVVKALPVLREQENKILEWLKANGYDAQNLPKIKKGCKTAKSYARAALNGSGVFEGSTTFNKAWDRLRDGGEIKEVE